MTLDSLLMDLRFVCEIIDTATVDLEQARARRADLMRALHADHGVTDDELAALTGLSRQSVNTWRNRID